jgi:hypothetical protein
VFTRPAINMALLRSGGRRLVYTARGHKLRFSSSLTLSCQVAKFFLFASWRLGVSLSVCTRCQ